MSMTATTASVRLLISYGSTRAAPKARRSAIGPLRRPCMTSPAERKRLEGEPPGQEPARADPTTRSRARNGAVRRVTHQTRGERVSLSRFFLFTMLHTAARRGMPQAGLFQLELTTIVLGVRASVLVASEDNGLKRADQPPNKKRGDQLTRKGGTARLPARRHDDLTAHHYWAIIEFVRRRYSVEGSERRNSQLERQRAAAVSASRPKRRSANR